MDNLHKIQPLLSLIRLDKCAFDAAPTPCIKTIKEALITVARSYGYRWVRYVFCRRADLINNEDTFGFYVSSFPEDFEADYRDNNCIVVDPLMRYTQDSRAPEYINYGTWHGLKDRSLNDPLGDSKKEKEVYRKGVTDMYTLCDSYGIRDGAFITIERSNNICWLSLGCDLAPSDHLQALTPQRWAELKHCLFVVDNLMVTTTGCHRCHAGISVNNQYRAKLSKKQIELLKVFYADPGISISNVAASLGVTVSTVNYHLANIRVEVDMEKASGLALATLAYSHGLF